MLERLRGDHPVAELCGGEGASANVCYVWLREFMEAGKARLTRPVLRNQQRRPKKAALAVFAGLCTRRWAFYRRKNQKNSDLNTKLRKVTKIEKPARKRRFFWQILGGADGTRTRDLQRDRGDQTPRT